jgi:hypothetical protein
VWKVKNNVFPGRSSENYRQTTSPFPKSDGPKICFQTLMIFGPNFGSLTYFKVTGKVGKGGMFSNNNEITKALLPLI